MLWSKYFISTLKEVPVGTEAISHQLSLRAGLVHMLTSGVYSYLPLGYRVLRKVENIIREEMDAIGCHELLMPALHPIEVWKKTGRDQTLKEVMFTFDNKKGHRMCLGPTHEEIITTIAKDFIQSYRQLPVTLYQIQTKFRDEIRTRFGIVRACEFSMKDAYSFDRDAAGLQKNYDLQHGAYLKIFKRCGLDVIAVAADSGAMGGSISHEFLVAAPIGEDAVWANGAGQYIKDTDGQRPSGPGPWERKIAIELGHIFQLGTKYSEALGAMYLDEDGKQKPIIMGCYGIGVSRLIAAIIETNCDAAGIIWPQEVAPFDVEILPVQAGDAQSMTLAQKYYEDLSATGLDVLLDDRDDSAGRKFNDADLIGIPYRVVLGKRALAQNQVEIKCRRTGKVDAVAFDQAVPVIKIFAGLDMNLNGLDSDTISQKINMLAMPILEQAGIDLVELNISLGVQEVMVRLAIDLPRGGITIAQCSLVNRLLVEAIDADGFLPEDGYSLEVSSPGLDRPLVNNKDFSRNLDRAIRIWLTEPIDGKKEHSGVLVKVNEDALVIMTKKNKEIVLPLGQIIKGMLVI